MYVVSSNLLIIPFSTKFANIWAYEPSTQIKLK